MRRRRATASACVCAALAVYASCKEPTAIRIEVRTNAAPSSVQSTTFTVRAPDAAEDSPPQAETTTIDASGYVGSLVAVPAAEDDASVVVKIVIGIARPAASCSRADGYAGCIVARRRLSYVPGSTLVLPIFLDVACRDVACDAASTCEGGACVGSEVSCSGRACTNPGEVTDGGPFDGGPRDGAPESATSLSDAADGGVKDGVVCGTKTCPNGFACCLDVKLINGASCVAIQNSCGSDVDLSGHRLECDGPEDCRSGGLCCATPTVARCAVSCTNGTAELCHTTDQCSKKGAQCLPSQTVNGYSECR